MTSDAKKKRIFLLNEQLIPFDENNSDLIYLSHKYFIQFQNKVLLLVNNISEEKFIILDPDNKLYDVFGLLLKGISYDKLIESLPDHISDKESFIAELWQAGIIL